MLLLLLVRQLSLRPIPMLLCTLAPQLILTLPSIQPWVFHLQPPTSPLPLLLLLKPLVLSHRILLHSSSVQQKAFQQQQQQQPPQTLLLQYQLLMEGASPNPYLRSISHALTSNYTISQHSPAGCLIRILIGNQGTHNRYQFQSEYRVMLDRMRFLLAQ